MKGRLGKALEITKHRAHSIWLFTLRSFLVDDSLCSDVKYVQAL